VITNNNNNSGGGGGGGDGDSFDGDGTGFIGPSCPKGICATLKIGENSLKNSQPKII
jgi:hypothetical protein